MSALHEKLRKMVGLGAPYQAKRGHATDARWQMIAARLGEADHTLIDIGCNLGAFTRRAAERGMFAIGLEPNADILARARRSNGSTPRLALMQFGLDPQSVDLLPRVDVMLCLSVHHYWAKIHGAGLCWEMVRKLVERTERKFFFEPAVIHKKYGANHPDFIENDAESVIAHVNEAFARITNQTKKVTYLGLTEGIKNRKEKFRPMFMVS